jgi:hypothetical protein
MVEPAVGQESDLLLRLFLEAPDGPPAEQLLARLLEEIVPLVREVVGYKLRVSLGRGGGADAQESEDVCSEALVQLLARLADLKSNGSAPRIQNFRSYVAVAAYHACAEHLRRRYPQRYSLKHKLRYLLTHQPGLALWENAGGEWVGGLSTWQKGWRTLPPELMSRLSELRDNPRAFAQAALPQGAARGTGLHGLLPALFHWVAQPVELDDLVGIVAEILGVKDPASGRGGEREEVRPAPERWPDRRRDAATELEQRRYLERLWGEVEEMSPRHVAALLLNLRDGQGGSALDLFLFTGVATFAQIARALALTEESLAEVWNHLPLDDATLAGRLSATRQQVVNWRKSARERLAKRMNAAGF